MSKGISVWALLGPSLQTAYMNRYNAENADPPEVYNGPMDDTSYAIMNTFADLFVVGPMYEAVPDEDDEIFRMYGMNFPTEEEAIDAMDYLYANWAGNQINILGAWDEDTGLQMGVTYTYDAEGDITGTTGTPYYPIPIKAYLVMPPVIVYDENGDEVSNTPATSNADLRDINLIAGQHPRDFG
jgi:hypothetical protein